ncbi:TetR/AcrR family transcriptional regulator [Pelotomaculum propionicicum]|uniref:TetR/AcrR family transcriptional regulator n=1 Tax=Pelotomaculum propionicicum TaxID=258475 RepID=UPI003B796578
MRNKINKSDLIMKAALEIFDNKNFKDVTISEIAERAGVAVGTVYEYFNNKEDLYFSIPQKTSEHFNEQLRLQLDGLYSSAEKIRKFIWFYLYYFENNPVYTELLLMELRVNKNFFNTEHYRGLSDGTTEILILIKEGQQQGEIRNDISPYLIRHMILGVLEHITTNWLLKGKKGDLVSFSKDTAALVLPGIILKQDDKKREDANEII